MTENPISLFFHRIQLVLLRQRFCQTISIHFECDSTRDAMYYMVGFQARDPISDPVVHIKLIQSYVRRCLLPWRKHPRCAKLLPQSRYTTLAAMVLYCSRRCQLGILFPCRVSPFRLVTYSLCVLAPFFDGGGWYHYSDVIMGAISSQIIGLTIVYSTVYSDADRRKH